MITALDTNVLLDVLIPESQHRDESRRALGDAFGSGALIICEPVYAELVANFPRKEELDRFLSDTGVRLYATTTEALYLAGQAWREYLRRRPPAIVCPKCGTAQVVKCDGCGAPVRIRQHMLTDLLVGGHAMAQADRLLTRDRGYYRTYFPALKLA